MPKRTSPSSARDGLTLLGNTRTRPPVGPSVDVLETFANVFRHRDYTIHFECADFTSLCPITGQPDFARIRIEYVPGDRCIETKSLKFYLASYRDTRSFNEEIVNRLLDDLVAACRPRRLHVQGEFATRGGITVTVDAVFPAGKRAKK